EPGSGTQPKGRVGQRSCQPVAECVGAWSIKYNQMWSAARRRAGSGLLDVVFQGTARPIGPGLFGIPAMVEPHIPPRPFRLSCRGCGGASGTEGPLVPTNCLPGRDRGGVAGSGPPDGCHGEEIPKVDWDDWIDRAARAASDTFGGSYHAPSDSTQR